MEKKYGKSWMHRTFRFWTATFVVILVGSFAVDGNNEICKQQEESSFHLRKLSSSTKSSQKCAELCCKDSRCTIPFHTKHHCYGIACVKKELCQVIFEQLKDFQGHRVDKRETDEDDEEELSQSHWQNDQGTALRIYQKRDVDSSNSTAEPFGNGIARKLGENGFPAFLITSEKDNTLNYTGGNASKVSQGENNTSSQTAENQFFVALNDSVYDADLASQNLVKRSNADENEEELGEGEDQYNEEDYDDSDEDDVDNEDDRDAPRTSCSKDSNFQKSTIPNRRKNYHFKRLARRSTSLKSCSRKCCKTDNCILSFIVEKTCLGILCKGDGDCHTKRERLPEMHFAISTVQRKENLDEDGSTENDEQKRSAVQSKDDEDVDGDIDEDEEEEDGKLEEVKKEKKSKKRKKHSSTKSHQKKTTTRKKSSKKHNKDTEKEHRRRKSKKHHQHTSAKKKSHHVHEASNVEDSEEEASGSGETELPSKRHEIDKGETGEELDARETVHSRKNEDLKSRDDEGESDFHQENNGENERKSEYSDDVKHLIYAKKPMNSTLFDDTVVGAEKEANDPDGPDSIISNEEQVQRSDVEEPEDNDRKQEEVIHLPNRDEEQAGRGDESMKMRESSVENDKRSDLMVEHSQYEDVEDRPTNDRDKAEDEAARRWHHLHSIRHKEHHKSKHGKHWTAHRAKEDWGRYGDSHHREFGHRSESEDYLRRFQGEFETPRHAYRVYDHKDHTDSRRYESFKGEEDNAEHSGMGEKVIEREKDFASGNYPGHHRSKESKAKSVKSLEAKETKQHPGTSRNHDKDSRASRKSHIHGSKKHSHKKKKKSKEKKKHSKMNREEKLIEKLEHLEEKIEKKQKSELEHRKEKILQKVENLASNLEKKTKASQGSKKEEKSGKKASKEHSKKSKTVEEKKEAQEMEGSGELTGSEVLKPEKIVIPPASKHHKKSKKKSSKKKRKKPHHQKKEAVKLKPSSLESIAVSGEGSSNGAMHHQSEASGMGEDGDGVEAHYLGFERDHQVEDTNWSQRNVVIPYINKKSHHGSHHSHDTHMPVLNENILDGLDKMRYEKKDKIAKPSSADKAKLKNEIQKVHSFKEFLEMKAQKSHEKSKHHKEKGRSKSTHKSKGKKDKTKHKKKSKEDKLMKEFEKYKAFVKAQDLAISGEGSGEGREGSGSKEAMVPVSTSKKSKSHKKSESKSSNKHKKHKSKKGHKDSKSLQKSALHSEGSGNAEHAIIDEEGSGTHAQKIDHGKGKHHGKVKGERVAQKETLKRNETSIEGEAMKKSSSNTTNSAGGNDKKAVEEGKTENKEPKMFLDRKASATGELGSDNVTAHVKDHVKVPPNAHSDKGTLGSQHKSEVISEKNTTWKNADSDSSKNATKDADVEEKHSKKGHESPKPNKEVGADQQKKASAVAPTKKDLLTTKPTTTTQPVVKMHITTTATPKTTIATTTHKQTVKAKPSKKKIAAKKKIHKTTPPPTRKLSTTGVPTLSILTGDEDVEEEKRPPTPRRKTPSTHHNAKASESTKLKKAKKKINVDISAGKANHIKEPSKDTGRPALVATQKPAVYVPPTPMQSLSPTVNIFKNRAMSQQMAGPGGSTGILGDLQLPEPPGNGNVASGPPFYGQQGTPARLPIQGPLGEMQYHNGQQSGLVQGGGPRNDFSNRQTGISVQPMPATVKPFQTSEYGGSSPLPRPMSAPQNYITTTKPPVAPSQKQLYNKIPESPQTVINRILGPKKASPVQIIQHILNPKQKTNDLHAGNSKPETNNKPNVKGPVAPNIKNSAPVQSQGKAKPAPKLPTIPQKKPSTVGKKPTNKLKPSNKIGKKPLAKLNDFFNKVDGQPPKKPSGKAATKALLKPTIPKKKVPESTAPIAPKGKPEANSCPVRQNLENMVLAKGRKSGEFTRMQGYPTLDTCIKQCCKTPTCDLLFKSGEVCYLVHCHNLESCKTEPLKEPTIRTRIVFVKKPEVAPQGGKPAICPGENAFGILWKETKPGHFATRTCPREAKGFAKRHCNDHSRWLMPDFSSCVSDQYTNLDEEVKHLGFTINVKDVLAKLEEITTQTIDNSMIFGGDIIKASSILDEVSKFVVKNSAERFGFGALRNFARSASNLLDDTNKQEWENVNRSLKGPGKIMRALENFGAMTAGKIPPINNNQPIITHNMVMSVARLSKIQKYVFPNYSVPLLKRWTTKKDQIILPGHLFKGGSVKVSSINYKNLAPLLPHQWNSNNHVTFTDGFRVNSKVIATTIRPEPTRKIDPPVTIILHHLKKSNSARTKCVYWDFNTNPSNGGSWSSNGCWVVTSNSTVTVCQCEHLTHFAVLMNLSDEDRVSAKEQAKENTFALMWLGIPVLVVLSVGAMYTCFAWSKAPRRRHVVVKDGKPKLPEDEVIVTKTVKEDFPGSPNRYLYSSYTSPSPSDLEWEHVWDFLTNSEFENWQCTEKFKRKRPRRRRLDLRPTRLLRGRKKKLKDNFETSEYFSEGDSSSARWKHQDDNEWSRERIKCRGKDVIDISSEASQPVDSLEEFSDDTSVADSKDGDKCSNSFDNFAPDAVSSPHAGYNSESKYYSFVYRSNLNLKEREQIHLSFNAESRLSSKREPMYSSCSSLETLHRMQPSRIQKTKYASTTCLVTIGRKGKTRLGDRKWSSKISLASSARTVMSSGFLDKTWSSKYASSLSISTLTRSVSTKTINDDIDSYHSGFENSVCENLSSEQGYGTFESSGAFSNDVMDMNITSSDTGVANDCASTSNSLISTNVPTYDMNLLTPSRKPTGVTGKPLESSSFDTSWMDDLEKDMENFERFLCDGPQTPALDHVLNDWREQSKAFLEDTFIMNMDLIGENAPINSLLRAIDPLPDANRVVEQNYSEVKAKVKALSHSSFGSSLEDLGIDMRTSSFDDTSLIPASIKSVEKQTLTLSQLEMNSVVENFGDIETESEYETNMYDADQRKTPTKERLATSKRGGHQNRIVSIPRTSAIKRKTKVLKKKIERSPTVATGLSTRSPTKHMRSYIVLRQQSRYTDNERHMATLERQESLSGSESRSIKRVNKTVARKAARHLTATDTVDNKEEEPRPEDTAPCGSIHASRDVSEYEEGSTKITVEDEVQASGLEEALTPGAVEIADREAEAEEKADLGNEVDNCLKSIKGKGSKGKVTFSGVDDVTMTDDGDDYIRRTVESR